MKLHKYWGSGKLMKIKTATLESPALDWAVMHIKHPGNSTDFFFDLRNLYNLFHYSTNWSQGGPIIEKEGIDLHCTLIAQPDHKDPAWRTASWRAQYHRMGFGTEYCYGPTALIAAMRCYVFRKLGDEIEIPEELAA